MDWNYDSWRSGEPYNWGQAARGPSPFDNLDFHVDLGCGAGLKKGRIGVDKFGAPGVNIIMDLDTLDVFSMCAAPDTDAPKLAGTGRLYSRGLHAGGQWYDERDMQVETVGYGLPFEDSSIESIISHHMLEHVGGGFLQLIEEIYRVLKPGGIFRAITPLFPSRAAVDDPTHVRYFTESTWQFCGGRPGETHWMESFSVPYTGARFEILDQDVTAMASPDARWKADDAREIRVALKAHK